MARYKQLAAKIVVDIEAGKLKSGDRMLSLRLFAKQHDISMSTAVNCYAELESTGWLNARPQAGFYIAEYHDLPESPQWPSFNSSVSSASSFRPPTGKRCGPLGTSRLQLGKTSQIQLERSMRRAMKRSQEKLSYYPEAQGEPALLRALATHFTHKGFPLKNEDLVITHGCMDAVKNALLVCTQPGDTVAISSPCYNGLLDLLGQLDLRVIEIPSVADGIDLSQFEQHLEAGSIQAGLFCTSHMNPQGLSLTSAQKEQLAALANRYCIPVIEDDVYLELNHQQLSLLPAAYFDRGGYMLWCGSVSKTLSPSYRIGWCRPGRYFDAYLKRALGVPTLIQYALADFIDSGAYLSHLKRANYQLSQNKARYLQFLSRLLPKGSRITNPDGGLVLWIQVPGLNASDFARECAKHELDIRIGSWFTESELYQDCLRINIGIFPEPSVERELEKLAALLTQSHCE